MPERNFVTQTPNVVILAEQNQAYQEFQSCFLNLEIMTLMVESNYGKDGGATPPVKPKIKVQGCD